MTTLKRFDISHLRDEKESFGCLSTHTNHVASPSNGQYQFHIEMSLYAQASQKVTQLPFEY